MHFQGRAVKIGHAVCNVEDLTPVDAHAGGCNAFISLDYRVIKLSNDLPLPTQAEHLIHEIMHAIRKIWGVDKGDESVEEAIVNVESYGLACVFTDNPQLIIELAQVLSGGSDGEKPKG